MTTRQENDDLDLGHDLIIATTMYREMDMCFYLDQAEAELLTLAPAQ